MTIPLIYGLPAYELLTSQVARGLGADIGHLSCKNFPDGERYVRILDDVRGRNAVIIGGTIDDQTTLTLYDLAYALVKYGVQRLIMVVPYFGYGTMERAVLPGEVVTAKTRARLLSSIPIARQGNSIILVDLHSEGVAHYFENHLTSFHVSAQSVVLDLIREFGGKDCVVASTDAGRAKWVEHLANQLGTEAAFVLKRRLSGSETETISTSAQVHGRHVVIYDDMIRSGSSLIGAAKTYREAGAKTVSAVATHGVLVGQSLQRILESGQIDRIGVTDTHPAALALQSPRFEVRSIAPVLIEALGRHL